MTTSLVAIFPSKSWQARVQKVHLCEKLHLPGSTLETYYKEKYDCDVSDVHEKIVEQGLPEDYHSKYNDTRKRFPQQKQNQLVMELLIDWFHTQSKVKYISR